MFDAHQKSTGTLMRLGIIGTLCGGAVLYAADVPCAHTGTERLGDVPCAAQSTPGHPVELSTYRGLQFGMNLTAAATQTGTKLPDVRVVHQQPALIQEMDWQPRPIVAGGPPSDTPKVDPVKEGVLSFFNGELYRIVVTYDRYRIEGMTADDMIQGISATYGMPTKPGVEIPFQSNYGDVAAVLARWDDPQYAYDLVRTGDRSSFALVLYSKRLEALAQAATVQAVRLEAQEAPQREIERQKKRDDDENLLLEKARSTNKPNFQP